MVDQPKFKTTVQALTRREEDYVNLELAVPTGFTWTPGQYLHLALPTKPVTDDKQVRALSISSIPSERTILLGTRTHPHEAMSSFKEQLLTLKPGEEVMIDGPHGDFTLQDESEPLVFFATGIGITPIRALIAELAKTHSQREVELIHVANSYHLYADDFSKFLNDLPQLKITYFAHGQAADEHLNHLAQEGRATHYYLSGSPKMVQEVRAQLERAQVAPTNISSDMLYGY